MHLVRDKAALLGQALNLAPYDALVDEFSPGITTADIDAMFKALSRRLPSLIREAIALQEGRAPLPLDGQIPAGKQRALMVEVMKAMGFPFDRGRLDESEHPFTEGVPGDIRVTTRFDPRTFSPACWARCTRPGMRCTTWGCRRTGATSRSAAIAAWRSRRASRCSSR